MSKKDEDGSQCLLVLWAGTIWHFIVTLRGGHL